MMRRLRLDGDAALPRCIDALFRADEIQFGAGRLHVAAVRLQR